MTDTALEPVIFERTGDGTWTHRYGPAPDGYGYRGKTVCCKRPGYAPADMPAYGIDEQIDDCCATPGIPKPVTLPPYSGEHATCRKCGSKAVETKYTRRTASVYGGIGPIAYPPEWLARRCTVCQAVWDESTAPHTDSPVAVAEHGAAGTVPVSVRWFGEHGAYVGGENRTTQRGSADMHALLAAWSERGHWAVIRVGYVLDAP